MNYVKIFIGPNWFGKAYELEKIKKSLFEEYNNRKDVYIAAHSPELLNMLNINFDNLFITLLKAGI